MIVAFNKFSTYYKIIIVNWNIIFKLKWYFTSSFGVSLVWIISTCHQTLLRTIYTKPHVIFETVYHYYFLGWSSWITKWSLGMSHSGDFKHVAYAQASISGTLQARSYRWVTLHNWPSPMVRQLFIIFRLSFWFSSVLCHSSIHIAWRIRPSEENIHYLGLPYHVCFPIPPPCPVLLCYTCVWLWVLRLLQLHPPHKRFLFSSEH